MKKTAILALAVAMPAMAGTPAPVVTVPAPAPVVVPAAPSCGIELAGVYNFASRDLYSVGKQVDTYGLDLTGVYALDANNAVTFRMGYTYGSEVLRNWDEATRDQVETFTLMPGYRYTKALNDTTSVFAGANVGLARMRIDERVTNGRWSAADNDSDWGFAYSAEVGVSKKLCDKVSVFAAYQFSGNTAKPNAWGWGDNIHQQTYHGIRAGVSVSF